MQTTIKQILAATLVLLAWAGGAHADDVVVTIYFSGTNLNSTMWNPANSPYNRSETIATLHQAQLDQPNHHKGIVDGIVQSFDGDPFQPNWQAQLDAAVAIFNDRPSCDGECVILNLVGFSRGAVSTMHTARKMFDQIDVPRTIRKINILALDPVPGDGLLVTGILGSNFVLPPTADFIGFYANDERSVGFSPVIPASSSANDNVDFFLVPGAHNTMIGSAFVNGHRDAHGNAVSRLDPLPRTLRIVATELLGSSDWGHVRFDPDVNVWPSLDWYEGETDIDVLRERFLGNHLLPIFDSYYAFMREFSLVAPLDVDLREGWVGNSCTPAGTADRARLSSRCVYTGGYIGLPLGSSDGPIGSVSSLEWIDAQDGGDYLLWQIIEERGSLDTDQDMVDYADDNCTALANPDQIDSDGDGIGNACDADLNNDCVVNALDLGLFKLVFFSNNPDADFNGDGVVNAADLGLLRLSFFGAPGPSVSGCVAG